MCVCFSASVSGLKNAYANKLSCPICTTIEDSPEDKKVPIPDNEGFKFAKMSADPFEKFKFTNDDVSFRLTPKGVSFVKDRWTSLDGLTKGTQVITLGVTFLNGNDSQKDFVRLAAAAWTSPNILGPRLAFRFDVPQEVSQIRIEFGTGEGNWSYVGRSNANIPVTKRTMSIDDLETYIVQHEFGHAICLQHEQQYPDPGGIKWNEARVIADCRSLYGWSEQKTRENIINKFKSPSAKCVGDPEFNPKSIMLYMIPPEWTLNGFSSGTNTEITNRDIQCVRGVYSL
jgi:hypothetical protein